VERARAYAKRLNASLAIIDKRREAANVSQVMNIIGDVQGRTCVIVDDIVDTAGTLTEAAGALKDAGAAVVSAAITHPCSRAPRSSGSAESSLTELVITDTVPLRRRRTTAIRSAWSASRTSCRRRSAHQQRGA
jgi:ribose-phosphate pyrophosphokinase